MKKHHYDIVVIGGGPSGLMAAISASQSGAKTLLIDKGKRLGRKLLLSGGGRCNVTNSHSESDIIKHIPGNGKFMYSPFSTFNNQDIIEFFTNLGVPLKEEDHGRMFPQSNKAKDVVNALLTQLEQQHVTVWTNAKVADITIDNQQVTGVILSDDQYVQCHNIIIATGGCSAPHTGSTGDGYPWAKKAGHTITPLFPTEVPLLSHEAFIQNKTLQGLSLRDIGLSVLNQQGKAIVTHQMDMIFTHFGISGPAALRCSQFIYREQQKQQQQNITVALDIFPHKTIKQVQQEIDDLLKDAPKKAIKNIITQYIPERYALFLLQQADINEHLTSFDISPKKLTHLCQLIKQFTFKISGTLPLEKAFVTGGGVDIKEVEPHSMMSKKTNGLFFCGEILDLHGYTGGYNITVALVTGYVAGLNASWQV